MSEKPVHSRLRRLVDWINLTGAKKVHSLIDKVYKRKNLEMAWEKVKANRGSGGVDGQSLEAFEAQLDQQLDRLQRELKEDTGRVLQTRSCPQALPTSRRLDPATHLVASVPALAQSRLETAACDQALRRVRACSADRFNSFSCIPASMSLRESCLHEMCTGSLGGGRRLARKRASSDPTIRFLLVCP